MLETLPENVVLEIFRRTDVPDLFRCAATCKRYRLLAAQPSFLRRRWPQDTHHRSSLLGFFTSQWVYSTLVPSFIRAPSSFPGPPCRVASFPDAPRQQELTSRGGLLLVCLDQNFLEFHLAVCDPITGTSRVLPPLTHTEYLRIRGYAILTGADCCSDEPPQSSSSSVLFFKVLIIHSIGLESHQPAHYNLRVLSSDESSWSAPKRCFDAWEHGIKAPPLELKAVVCQGTAHWLFRSKSSFRTLNVSVQTEHATLTKLSVTPSHVGRNFRNVPRLGVTNGVLSLIAIHRKGVRIQIWTCQGDTKSGGNWLHTKMIELQRPNPQDHSKIVEFGCIGERSGTMLIKTGPYGSQCVYVVDLQTGAMEEVTDWFLHRTLEMKSVAFEIDWPAFFMSRLAGGSIKQAKLGEDILSIATL